MDMITEYEATVNLQLPDFLDFGFEFEYFSDMLRDRIITEQGIPQDGDEYVNVTGYGFLRVVEPSTVAMTVHFTIETDDE